MDECIWCYTTELFTHTVTSQNKEVSLCLILSVTCRMCYLMRSLSYISKSDKLYDQLW